MHPTPPPSSPSPLPRACYEPDAAAVAPRLLGHWLLRRAGDELCGGIIVETEAYLRDDPASHGFKGPTARNAAMFGPPGLAYVYFIYGNHWCFNAVCHAAGVAEAVLLRAIEPTFGREEMERRRRAPRPRDLTNGPAKLCAALGLDRQQNHADLCSVESPVFIAHNPARDTVVQALGGVTVTTRIGLSKAAHLPLRFLLPGSEYVSRPAR